MGFDVGVDGSFFTFQDGWEVAKIDEWVEHRRAAVAPLGAKACDLLAIGDGTAWLIEVKDYTYPGASIPSELFNYLTRKLWHSMGLIHAVARWGQGEHQQLSLRALHCAEMRFCFAVELPDGGRGQEGVAKPLADVLAKLKRPVRATGLSRPVVSNSFLLGQVPWSVRRDPSRRKHHRDR